MIIRLAPDESPVLKNYVPMLASESLALAQQALGVRAQGSDPRRDVPEARRLRGPHARPAWHDRRARRLLRPRRHARFADGARARHLQLGRDAVARARPRDHAAAVGQPPAAVVERGHVGVRRAAGAARLGPRHGHPVRARDRSRRRDQDSRAELRLQQLADDQLCLLPGLAGRRVHSRHSTGKRSCARLSPRMPTAATPRRRSRRRSASTSTNCKRDSTSCSTSGTRRCAPR